MSYGGSNRVTNVAYSKYSPGGEASSSLSGSAAAGPASTSASGVYMKNVGTDPLLKDQDVVVLLPQRKSRTPRIRHKLAVSSRCIIPLDLLSDVYGKFSKGLWSWEIVACFSRGRERESLSRRLGGDEVSSYI